MAYAEPAYRLDALPSYEPAPRRSRERITAVPGGASSTAQQTSIIIQLAKMAAVLLVVAAVLSFARIALTSATVTTMIDNDALSSQIAEARADGTSLEMEQSALTSPSALKNAVKRLGMSAPYTIDSVELSPDVVATQPDGALSLSGSVKKVVGIQE